MALDASMFQNLAPSRFVTFSFPNPMLQDSSSLRIAVLDSPIQPSGPPRVAAMLVPESREQDWIFCTELGHLQLLFSSAPDLSRLILVGKQPSEANNFSALNLYSSSEAEDTLAEPLKPLFIALSPKICFENGIPDVPVLIYEDNLVSTVMREKCTGPIVGEFLVEDVEIENNGNSEREFRRRLRFKRMPNLIQTQVRIIPESDFDSNSWDIRGALFRIDSTVLVHPYLAPMVAGLSLVGPFIEEKLNSELRPTVLCVGVGGGALLSFLSRHLDFNVWGVEVDEKVLWIAREYFGLEDNEFTHIIVGEALQVIEKLAAQTAKDNVSSNGFDSAGFKNIETRFDVVMVDLDAGDVRTGLLAPPHEFVNENVLLTLRSILSESGILIVNVIPPNKSFYETLLSEFRESFVDLYEIDVENEENVILIATVASPTNYSSRSQSSFQLKLRSAVPEVYIDGIKKI